MLASRIISLFLWCVALAFFACTGTLFLIIAVFVPPRRFHRLVRLVCYGILLSCGQVLRVRGKFPDPEEGPFIYMFNHSSMLDTFILIALIPEFVGAVGKREQFDIPLWGWILRRWGAVPIDRMDREGSILKLTRVEESIRNGLSLVIAPEGTRSSCGEMGALKKGPFYVAKNTGAKILPVGISGAFRAKNRGSWLFRPGKIEVAVGNPLEVRAESENAVEDLRNRTAASLDLLRKS